VIEEGFVGVPRTVHGIAVEDVVFQRVGQDVAQCVCPDCILVVLGIVLLAQPAI